MYDYRIVSVLTATEPITLLEAKNYIRVTNDQDDTLIENMISEGRQLAETYLSKDILSRSREVFISYVDREIKLPYAPIDTDVDITVTVEDNLIAADQYSTFGYEDPAVRLSSVPARDVKITYTTKGLGTEVKQGVLAATAFLYKAAGRGEMDTMKNIMTDYKSLLAPYRKLYI